MSDNIKVKHFRGGMEAQEMADMWLRHWLLEALEAEERHNKLIIFEVPEDYDQSRIEAFLQNDLKQ
jgi:hypothetical protein